MNSERIFVVLPAFNEQTVIENVVKQVARSYPNVVVVDDGSSDDTAAAARHGGAVVLRHMLNRGQGAALQTAIDHSLRRGAGCIVTFDSDGQHDVADIDKLVQPIADGRAEIVLGTRFKGDVSGIPAGRRLLLKTAVLFTRFVSGATLTDAHNGLRAFSRTAAQRIQIRCDRMAHASELIDQIQRSGLRYVEVPVSVRYTEYSKTKGQSNVGALRILIDYVLGRILG